MTVLATIFKWALANWWEILLMIAAIGVYYYGIDEGVNQERLTCNTAIQKIRDDEQTAKDKLKKQIDAESDAYQKEKDAKDAKIKDIQVKYENAKKNKTALACPATAFDVRLYKQATTSSGN